MAEGMTLEEQGEVGRAFVADLLSEFGMEGTVETRLLDEDTVEIAALGEDLGILVGPRGSTLTALQDLTRAVVQRQCPSRTDRILVDVAGYRERRSAALKRFSTQIADRSPGLGPGEGARAHEPGRPQGRARRHQRDAWGRDPLRGRGPQPPHRHRASGLTRRRCPAPTRGATPPPCCTRSSPRRARRDSSDPARSSVRSGTPRGSPPSPAACLPAGPARLVDLGSGGGLPGLVVATDWPEATVALLEANGRRAAFLRRAVERLGLAGRVSVLEERAEVCGRQEDLRAGFDGALARSFGRPAVVAECAAPLLKVGGWLIVSEPPRSEAEGDQEARWPAEPLRQLGLEPAERDPRGLRIPDPAPGRTVPGPLPSPQWGAGEEDRSSRRRSATHAGLARSEGP